ncbi:unnamed protein product, partial [Staurois parvus]
TLYCQKYWDTPPNHWIQVFQSPPWPQVYKIKHLGMQTSSTNICERMGRFQEISEFKHGTVIGCHLCNKSIREISLLLNIPRSTVNGIITKWKQLGTTATQPPSGRPRKMTERDQHMLKRTESIAKDLQTSFPVKGTLKASAYQFHTPNFVEQFGNGSFLFQHDCTPV